MHLLTARYDLSRIHLLTARFFVFKQQVQRKVSEGVGVTGKKKAATVAHQVN
jgi:hypothetical protein